MTTSAATLDLLMETEFVFDDEAGGGEDWYRNGDVRVVIDDSEIAIYRLTVGAWSIRLTNVPPSVLAAVLRGALEG